MILAEIRFPKTEYENMYFRGGEAQSDGSLLLKAGNTTSLDTYFGSFAYTKYRDYTRLSEVTLTLTAEGDCTVSLRTFDGEKEEIVCKESLVGGEISLAARFDALPKHAILYPVIEANEDTVITSMAYVTDETPDNVRAAIAFCTFRREAALTKNVAALTEQKPLSVERVIVIDNGKTIGGDIFDQSFVTLFKNETYGGSAGFTR